MLPLKTILHPTDFSERSEYAFQFACSLARDHGAKLVVVHVVPTPQMVAYGEMPIIAPQQAENYLTELNERLRQVKPPMPGVPVEYRLEEGDAARVIAKLARELDCQLIVMGTHGRTGLGRLLMGSVAEQVLRNAPCPVLTVKNPVGLAEKPEEQEVAAISPG